MAICNHAIRGLSLPLIYRAYRYLGSNTNIFDHTKKSFHFRSILSNSETLEFDLSGIEPRPARSVYMLLGGPLTYGAAGLANSVISRANAMANVGWDVTILVDVWQPDVREQVSKLKDVGHLENAVEVRNIFEDLAQLSIPRKPVHRSPSIQDFIGGMSAIPDPDRSRVVRYYRGGEYCYFAWMTISGKIQFLDELIDGQRSRRLFFAEVGALTRTTFFDADNAPLFDEYYSLYGEMYWRESHARSGAGAASLVLNKDGQYTEHWDADSVLTMWLENCIGLGSGDYLISEYAFKMDALEEVKEDTGAWVIYTLHNCHFAFPHRYGSSIKPELRPALERIPDMDALVVLTPQQKFDIEKDFKTSSNVHVVSHAVPRRKQIECQSIPPRDPNLIVSVGRLAASKGHDRLIRSFGSVLDRHPEAVLEIWGRGEIEAELRDLISSLGLDAHVKLCGFATDPTFIYQRASIALFPSRMEGQPLVLMESMDQGCVPVCFDFKYGARMLVKDLMNGVLVDADDIGDSSGFFGSPFVRSRTVGEFVQERRKYCSRIHASSVD